MVTQSEIQNQVDGIFKDVVAAAKGEFQYEGTSETHDDGTLYDYFEDMLDATYEVRRNGDGTLDVIGCKFMVSYGGPNIYVTEDRVELYWWNQTAFSKYFDEKTKNALLDFAREIFNN